MTPRDNDDLLRALVDEALTPAWLRPRDPVKLDALTREFADRMPDLTDAEWEALNDASEPSDPAGAAEAMARVWDKVRTAMEADSTAYSV